MRFYAAYGSNLNMEQMQYRCPDAYPIGVGRLEGYELLFKGSKTGSYATVEKCEGSSVPIGVWAISNRDERNLDVYEGCPTFYYKKVLPIKMDKIYNGSDDKVMALVYIMHEDRNIGQPTQHYAQVCMKGYDDFGMNKMDFYEALICNILREEKKEVMA